MNMRECERVIRFTLNVQHHASKPVSSGQLCELVTLGRKVRSLSKRYGGVPHGAASRIKHLARAAEIAAAIGAKVDTTILEDGASFRLIFPDQSVMVPAL